MQENYKLVSSDDRTQIYLRHVASKTPSSRAVILLNSRSLCAESSMGQSMGSESYAEYLANRGVHAYLVDLRGYGMSTPIEEQLVEDRSQLEDPLTWMKYYRDLKAAAEYVRSEQGDQCVLGMVGFSLLGPLIVGFADLYPELVDRAICLNPLWRKYKTDPLSGFVFVASTGEEKPYLEVSMERINQRLESAQPPGKNFIEPLWYTEAQTALAHYHKTYNPDTAIWRVAKIDLQGLYDHLDRFKGMTRCRAEVLVVSSQYDTENPTWLARRMFNSLRVGKKYFKVLPNATHLCIWEQARTTLYEWTREFMQ